MPSDVGYVVIREDRAWGSSVEICAARDSAGIGTNPHAVHTGVVDPVLHNPEVFTQAGSLRYSNEPQVVFVEDRDTRVQVASLRPMTLAAADAAASTELC